MDLGLNGKSALITGASKGIGRAIAVELAAEGCNLHLAARSVGDLQRVKQELADRFAVDVAVHSVDLSRGEDAKRLAAACGPLDILVNNAGAIPGGRIDQIDEPLWRAAWDLKVFGYFNLTREVYSSMTARGQGVIINVIGLAGQRPDGNYVAGSAGNASLMAFTQAVGGISIERGVRVVGVNPGLIETERLVKFMSARAQVELGDSSRWRELLSHLPQGRLGKPDEIAAVVAFLASPRASLVNGIVVDVDNGFAARGNLFGPTR